MEVSTPDTPQMNQMSGLSGLANLIQKKHPGYTRKEAFELIKSVRNQNGGKLVGLKMKRFFKIAKDIGRRNITKMREKKNQEGSEGLKLKQTVSKSSLRCSLVIDTLESCIASILLKESESQVEL